jgi:hypothetical protein
MFINTLINKNKNLVNGIKFTQNQCGLLDVYSGSSMKQQTTSRHVALLGYFILILTQPVFALSL